MVEAAPESLELKRSLFSELSRQVVTPDCVLATKTSSLLVTAIAAGAEGPERVVGMHFFNPAPVMDRGSWSTAATGRSAWRRSGC